MKREQILDTITKIGFVINDMERKTRQLKDELTHLTLQVKSNGGKKNDFPKCKKYLNSFCKSVFNFGDVSKASSAKLLSNFLSLMTTTSVIEFFKSAKKLGINIKLLCDVARLGSGNSGALDRIANKAIKGNYKGYVFSVDNTYKDLNYINDLVSDLPNANKLSKLAKSFYKEASKKGFGNFLVSELIDKEKY